MPVDELHSIENKEDKTATILLTLEMEGVKTHSFFDKFSRLTQSEVSFPKRASEEETG